MPSQTLLSANMGDLCWRGYSMWLCFLSLRMACPREGYIACNHPIQLVGIERPTVPGCFSTIGCSRTRIIIPSSVHSSGVPGEDCIHRLLVNTFSTSIRQARTSIAQTACFPAR